MAEGHMSFEKGDRATSKLQLQKLYDKCDDSLILAPRLVVGPANALTVFSKYIQYQCLVRHLEYLPVVDECGQPLPCGEAGSELAAAAAAGELTSVCDGDEEGSESGSSGIVIPVSS